MKLYQASLNLRVLKKHYELFPDKMLNVLRSFGVLKNENFGFMETHRSKIDSLVLDSGTWPLNNTESSSSSVSLEGYMSYLSNFHRYFDYYFNFDSDHSIDGFETNINNQIELEEAGLNPVPVIHDIYGEEVDCYIDNGYTMVAIGSSQVNSPDDIESVVDKLYAAGIKIHLFGRSSYRFLAPYPLYSCDSTTWALTGGYGYMHYWNPNKKSNDKTDKIYLEEKEKFGGKKK